MPYFTNRAITPLPSAVTGITWNSATKDADIALSGSDLVMTCASGDGGCLGTGAGKSAGKYYWQITLNTWTSGSPVTFGFVNASHSVADYGGSDVNSVAFLNSVPAIYYNGGQVLGLTTVLNAGGTLCMALDLDNGKFYSRVGTGGSWNDAGDNPATNTGGYTFPVSTPVWPYAWIRGGDQATADFTTMTFAPSGFGAWS